MTTRKSAPEDHDQTMRKLPRDEHSEAAVLSCILQDSTVRLPESIAAGLTREDFFNGSHRIIFDAIMTLFSASKPIDLITVTSQLSSTKEIDHVGGIEYVSKVLDAAPSPSSLGYYLSIVLEKSMLRRAVEICRKSEDEIYESTNSADEIIGSIERSVMGIRKERKVAKPMREICMALTDILEQRAQGKSGLSTGIADLDRFLSGGLQKADYFVVAARPSCGKTSFAMTIATNVSEWIASTRQDAVVAVYSLEMTSEALVERMVSADAKVNTKLIALKKTTPAEEERLCTSMAKVARLPIVIEDSGGMTISEIRAKTRLYATQQPIALIVIDYLQLIKTSGKEDRRVEVDNISREIKALAKETNCPVIVVAQLNRQFEKDQNRRPRMSDLRESGQIEQDADIIGMLYNDTTESDADDIARNPAAPRRVNMFICKQRNGMIGDVPLMFFPEFTRFEQCSKFPDVT